MKKNQKSLESLTQQLFKTEKNYNSKAITGGEDGITNRPVRTGAKATPDYQGFPDITI